MPGTTTADRLRSGVWPLAALLLLLAILWMAVTGYNDVVITRVAILALINMVFVVGLWTFSGMTGVVSFGHLGFGALGAYACAFLTIPPALKNGLFPDMPGFLHFLLTVHTGFGAAIVISGLVAGLFALIVSPAIVRLAGLQAGIATIALLAIIYTVLLNWNQVTRGSSTMIGVPADLGIGTATLAASAVLAVAWAFARSRVGLRAVAAREDEPAARSLGLRVVRDRGAAWVLSAFLVGCGGGLYAHFITTFNPDQFYLAATFVVIAMLVFGGIGSLAGAVLGTLLYSALAEVLRRVQGGDLGGLNLPAGTAEVVLAALLLLVLIKRPGGLTGGHEIPWPGSGRLRRRGAVVTSGEPAPD